MNRQVTTTFLFCLFAACAAPTESALKRIPEKPNIVLVVIDDMGWTDLGCQGSAYYESPNIDRLASEGVRFTDAYSSGPNCSPSRAALLTGNYPSRTGVTTVLNKKVNEFALIEHPRSKSLSAEQTTFADVLRGAGYKSISIGKWHLGKEKHSEDPLGQGFNENVGGTQNGHPGSYHHPFGKGAGRVPVEAPEGSYLTDVLTDRALDFVRRHQDEPFCLYLPYYSVHTPIQPRADLMAKYEAKEPVGGHKNPGYAAMVEAVDEGVGRILALLDELELREETLVIVTSDNGGHSVTSNAPLRGRKGMLYEGGLRVPLIVRLPGVTDPGTTCAEPTLSMDIFPTLAKLAGASSEESVDGSDLMPLFAGEERLERDAIFWHFPHYLAGRQTPASAMRMGDWKLIETFETGDIELYELSSDIGEGENLAAIRPEKAAAMHSRLKAWRASIGAKIPLKNPNWPD